MKNLITIVIASVLAVVNGQIQVTEQENAAPDPNNILDLQLIQVQVVARHGSRYPTVDYDYEVTGVMPGSLTPNGELQMYQLGQWLKKRYNVALGNQFDYFTPTQVHIESSATDATIVSSYALSEGLYDSESRDPDGQIRLNTSEVGSMRPSVPVYTVPDVHDVGIRAFNKCPNYDKGLQELYNSLDWREIEEDNRETLTTLAKVPAFQQYIDRLSGMISLNQLHLVYDMVDVAVTDCSDALFSNSTSNYRPTTCDQEAYALQDMYKLFDLMSDDEFYKFTNLTHEIEVLKWGSEAGKLIGGNIMGQIGERMFAAGDVETFFVYLGHHETLMGIFSAMFDTAPIELDVFPNFGSAIIFELYEKKDTKEKVVKIVYRDGEMGDDALFEHIPWGRVCPTDDTCPLQTFLDYLVETIRVDDWCDECANDSADMCLVEQVDACSEAALFGLGPNLTSGTVDVNNYGSTPDGSQTQSYDDEEVVVEEARGLFMLGAFFGFLMGYCPLVIWYLVRRYRRKSTEKEQPTNLQAAREDAETESSDVSASGTMT